MNELNLNFLGLIDNTPMCIKLFDGKGNLLFLNKFGREEHFLSDDADVSKWDWRGTIKNEYLPEVDKKVEAVLNGRPIENLEFEHTREGSTHEWCAGALSSVKDEQGNVAGILFYSIDITDKKKAEKAIEDKVHELETMNKFMVDREIKMVELKNELEEVKSKLAHA